MKKIITSNTAVYVLEKKASFFFFFFPPQFTNYFAPSMCQVFTCKNSSWFTSADYSTSKLLLETNYPLPSVGIFTQLNGDRIFSNLDLSEAYMQILINEKCAGILAINIHKCLFKFLRLPFGIKVALVILQQMMDTMLSRLDFAIACLDGILIKSKIGEHARHIKKVFQKISCPTDWGCRIHWLLLYRGVRPPHHHQQVSWIWP